MLNHSKLSPQVFAHYFTWFATKETSGEWSHWDWKGKGTPHDPDRRLDSLSRRDIASVQYPLLGPYDSSSPQLMETHIQWAKAALIDAFCVDWYGPEFEKSRFRDRITDLNFKTFLEIAARLSFSICVCYEEKILTHAAVPKDSDECVRKGQIHLNYIAENYFGKKSYWKIDGRPALVIWGNHSLPAEAWKKILSTVQSWNPVVFYSYHHPLLQDLLNSKTLIDGFYPWMNIHDLKEQEKDLEKFYQFAKSSSTFKRTKWMCGGVWPGFNDAGVNGWGGGSRIIFDPGDRLYDLTWKAALENGSDIVSIATWNDWNEGSVIEPSVELGFKRLEQTRQHIQKLKRLGPATLDFSQILPLTAK